MPGSHKCIEADSKENWSARHQLLHTLDTNWRCDRADKWRRRRSVSQTPWAMDVKLLRGVPSPVGGGDTRPRKEDGVIPAPSMPRRAFNSWGRSPRPRTRSTNTLYDWPQRARRGKEMRSMRHGYSCFLNVGGSTTSPFRNDCRRTRRCGGHRVRN
jgi:hypothetical protein